MKLPLILLLFVGALSITDGFRILLVIPFPGPSHFLMFKSFIKELVNRGHQVTSISAFPFEEKLGNYTEVLVEPRWSFGNDFSQEMIFDMRFTSQVDMLFAYWIMGLGSTEHALKSKAVQDFIKQDNSKFDLILAEQFFQEAFLMFAHKYKAPIVTISTYGYSDFMDHAMGSLTPYSFVPHMVLYNYDDDMSFFQRFYNVIFSMYDAAYRRFSYLPKMDKMAQEHFGHLDGPLPSVSDLEKSISMILVNSHFAMVNPRPLMPGMVNIAGAHVKPVKPLPDDLQNFLDNAEHGVIYMSLGAYVQSASMPEETMKTILKVFGSLKQRVLWKFESDKMPKLPSNVMVRKWLPQSDILAHPKLLLFIAHGGLFGTIEASVRGVPILFMPFYGDQYKNAKLAETFGYAQRILFSEITESSLKSKINEVISNKKYRKKAKEISKIINDNPVKPMDEAMYWIEYVVRYNGAKHLKSPAVNLSWYKYLMLDVFVAVLAFIWLLWKILKTCFKSTFSVKGKSSPAGSKKKN